MILAQLDITLPLAVIIPVAVPMVSATLVVVMVAVIFVIPVAFVEPPTLLIMVVVGMTVVGARIRRTIPAPLHPDIATAVIPPVAIDPLISLTRHRPATLIAQRWRGSADIDADLSNCRSCNRRSHNCCGQPGQFHISPFGVTPDEMPTLLAKIEESVRRGYYSSQRRF
jgi:hypothetical protein